MNTPPARSRLPVNQSDREALYRQALDIVCREYAGRGERSRASVLLLQTHLGYDIDSLREVVRTLQRRELVTSTATRRLLPTLDGWRSARNTPPPHGLAAEHDAERDRRTRTRQDRRVRQAIRDRPGKLDLVTVATETGLPFVEAEQCIRRLLQRGDVERRDGRLWPATARTTPALYNDCDDDGDNDCDDSTPETPDDPGGIEVVGDCDGSSTTTAEVVEDPDPVEVVDVDDDCDGAEANEPEASSAATPDGHPVDDDSDGAGDSAASPRVELGTEGAASQSSPSTTPTKEPAMQPTSRHNEVLAILKEHQPCSGTDIARRCGVSSQFVNKILRELLDAGAVKCRRDGPRWLYSDAPGLPAPAPAPVPAPVVAGLGSVVVEINGAAVDRAVVEGLPSGALRSPPPRPRPDVGWREPVASDFPDLERVRKRDRVWRAVGRLARWVVRR